MLAIPEDQQSLEFETKGSPYNFGSDKSAAEAVHKNVHVSGIIKYRDGDPQFLLVKTKHCILPSSIIILR